MTNNPKKYWSETHGYPAINEKEQGFYPECLVCNGHGSVYEYPHQNDQCPNCDGLGWANFLHTANK
jgi:DnaJ-class molecular chaperone